MISLDVIRICAGISEFLSDPIAALRRTVKYLKDTSLKSSQLGRTDVVMTCSIVHTSLTTKSHHVTSSSKARVASPQVSSSNRLRDSPHSVL